MGDARYTKNGFLIPSKWLKGFGAKLRIQRGANVLIIESEEREASRKQLGRMVRALRGSAAKLGGPTLSEIEKLVNEVRKARAGRH
ncbi:MAG: hypothetical protein HY081_11080 [Gammaproteobacteria bacterium]|nr:hypothetical protein [Gammaproteobacteria bacterium]